MSPLWFDPSAKETFRLCFDDGGCQRAGELFRQPALLRHVWNGPAAFTLNGVTGSISSLSPARLIAFAP